MKKLLNTLYVQSQGSYLRQEGETVVAEREREVVARIPIHTLSGIVFADSNRFHDPHLRLIKIFYKFLNNYTLFSLQTQGFMVYFCKREDVL